MKFDLNKEYQLANQPYVKIILKEVLSLNDNEVYIRYKSENREEEWKIISQNKLKSYIEDYCDPQLVNMIDINNQYPEQGRDIFAVTSDNIKGYYYRCNHSPGCKTWKCSISGYTVLVDIVKWKYI